MKHGDDLPVLIFSPESQIRTPGRLLHAMWHDLKSCRELAWRLFVRNKYVKYRGSILGVLWSFLPPILTGAVFIILQSNKIINLGETGMPYPVFALIGTSLWQLFSESVNAPLKAVSGAKSMLVKIRFPHEALILSAFYELLYDFIIKLIIIMGILIFFGVQLTFGTLLALLPILALVLLGMTIGFFLTPLGLLYKDVSSAIPIILQLWFFMTPVIYPPSKSYPFSIIAIVNPVSPILTGARDLAVKGFLTNSNNLLIISGLSVIVFFISWIIYRLAVPIIVERIGA